MTSLPGGDATRAAAHPTAMVAIRATVEKLGDWTGPQLRELSHRERPWQQARGDLSADAQSQYEITMKSMEWFYRQLVQISMQNEPDLGV